MLERASLERLHHHKGPSFACPEIMDGANVWMIERRGGSRLALEPFEGLWIPGHLRREKLQGHMSAKPGVLRFIDHAHAAATEFVKNAVVRDVLPNQRELFYFVPLGLILGHLPANHV